MEDIPGAAVFTNTAGGTLTASRGAIVEIGVGCTLINAGSVTIGPECDVNNYGTLENNGIFSNNGFILNAGTVSGSVEITNNVGAVIKRVLAVKDETELAAALSDLGAEYSGIIILEDIRLTADMTINKPVEINYSATLRVPDHVTLTVTYADTARELMVKGGLEIFAGGELRTETNGLEDDAELWGQVTVNDGELTAPAGSHVINNGRILLIDGVVDIPTEGVLSGRPWFDILEQMSVESFAGLEAALEEGRCRTVELSQSFALQGNITLNKNLIIPEDVTLTVPNGKNFTVDNGASIKNLGTLSVSGIEYKAKVNDWAALEAASGRTIGGGTEKYYFCIEIRDGSEIVLENELKIEASVFIEWDSGIQVPEEITLSLIGAHKIDNSGDIWVLGTLATEADYTFCNFGYIQVGGGADTAMFENGGSFYNGETVEVWTGGTFNNIGSFDGNAPDDSNGGEVNGIM